MKPRYKDFLRLIEEQNYRCALTGQPLTPDIADADHIVPVKSGGQHVVGNLQILHSKVNAMKNTLSQEDFIEWCHKVAEHNPRQKPE